MNTVFSNHRTGGVVLTIVKDVSYFIKTIVLYRTTLKEYNVAIKRHDRYRSVHGVPERR